MRSFFRVISLLVLGCVVVGVYNVYADDPVTQAAARRAACGGVSTACHPRLSRLMRSPFKQAFVFVVGASETKVDCTRSFLLVGGMQCAQVPGR